MAQTAPILNMRDLDDLRVALLGRGAVLTFFSVTPLSGEAEIVSLTKGWCPWRRVRGGFDPSGTVTVVVSKQAKIDVEQIRENAVMEITNKGQTRRYQVFEVTETQDLNSGWVLHGGPIKGTV
jgi:hypothetical protein